MENLESDANYEEEAIDDPNDIIDYSFQEEEEQDHNDNTVMVKQAKIIKGEEMRVKQRMVNVYYD